VVRGYPAITTAASTSTVKRAAERTAIGFAVMTAHRYRVYCRVTTSGSAGVTLSTCEQALISFLNHVIGALRAITPGSSPKSTRERSLRYDRAVVQ
jgi:hypothetical protein